MLLPLIKHLRFKKGPRAQTKRCLTVITMMRKKTRTSTVLIICSLLLSASTIAGPKNASEPANAQATATISLKSGNGSPGQRDPFTQFSVDGGISYYDAFIVEPYWAYSVIPGTNYLSASPDLTLPAPGITRYRTLFQLPQGFSNASLVLQVHADNAATFFLNGVQIGQQVQMDTWDNFQDPAESFAVNDSSLFKGGTNVLEIEVLEIGGITALDYAAQVKYSTSNTLAVPLDIKPTSCPNPLKVGERGVLPVAILGTSQFDVTHIDPSTIKLAGLSPFAVKLEDVATPYEPVTGKAGAGDCNTLGADGHTDLTLHFDHPSVVSALGAVVDGQVLVVKMTGSLKPEYGGNPIEGEDVVIIRKKK